MTTKPKICARFLCKNEVPRPRTKYCSYECYIKGGHAAYRSNHREEIKIRQAKYDKEYPKQAKQRRYQTAKRHYISGKLPKWMFS